MSLTDFSEALDSAQECEVDDGPCGEETAGQLGADLAGLLDAARDVQHVLPVNNLSIIKNEFLFFLE